MASVDFGAFEALFRGGAFGLADRVERFFGTVEAFAGVLVSDGSLFRFLAIGVEDLSLLEYTQPPAQGKAFLCMCFEHVAAQARLPKRLMRVGALKGTAKAARHCPLSETASSKTSQPARQLLLWENERR